MKRYSIRVPSEYQGTGVDINNWQTKSPLKYDTATDTLSLPAVIYPNASSITVGLKGQSSQASTPSPSQPCDVLGCGERTGNLLPSNSVRYQYAIRYESEVITYTGGAMYIIPIKNGETYTVKIYTQNVSVSVIRLALYDNSTPISNTEVYNVKKITDVVEPTLTITNSENKPYLIIQIAGAYVDTYGIDDVMLNTGSTALPYEPHGYKIPILLNSQTINKYLGEVQTERQIKKLVLTGEETTWRITGSGRIAVRISDGTIPENATCICTHFKGTDVTAFTLIGDGECSTQLIGAGGYREIGFYSDTYTTLEAFQNFVTQQYANGTPVTVWYVLATPQTGIVNEPLMKIGNYADSVSVANIPTTAGSQTFDVDTTLKPSEVDLTYHGWHRTEPKEIEVNT